MPISGENWRIVRDADAFRALVIRIGDAHADRAATWDVSLGAGPNADSRGAVRDGAVRGDVVRGQIRGAICPYANRVGVFPRGAMGSESVRLERNVDTGG